MPLVGSNVPRWSLKLAAPPECFGRFISEERGSVNDKDMSPISSRGLGFIFSFLTIEKQAGDNAPRQFGILSTSSVYTD